MEFVTRSLSPQESRVVLALAEQGRREIARPEIVQLLGVSPKAADHVINSLRRKGWLERASWGKYLLIPPDQGPEALGESNSPRSRQPNYRAILHWLRYGRHSLRADDPASQRNLARDARASARPEGLASTRSGSSILSHASSSDSARLMCLGTRSSSPTSKRRLLTVSTVPSWPGESGRQRIFWEPLVAADSTGGRRPLSRTDRINRPCPAHRLARGSRVRRHSCRRT